MSHKHLPTRLPTFESYDGLDSYLSRYGKARILDDILVLMVKTNKGETAQERALMWWNEKKTKTSTEISPKDLLDFRSEWILMQILKSGMLAIELKDSFRKMAKS